MTTAPAGPRPPHTPARGEEQPHTAGATPYDLLVTPGHDFKTWLIRGVLGLVMSAALGVGTWSIYTLLTEVFGTPEGIAVLGCGLFDVAGIFFALLAQSYATTTDSGLAPRLAMLAMVTTSSWVNWKHAQMENWGTVGGVIFAAAPVIAELAFEMWHRFEHRETLRRLGRVADSLPVLGKWAWIAHPIRSRKTIDAHIKAALTEQEAVAKYREKVADVRAAAIVQGAPHSTRGAHATPLTQSATADATVTLERIPVDATERPQSAPDATLPTRRGASPVAPALERPVAGATEPATPPTPVRGATRHQGATDTRHDNAPHATTGATPTAGTRPEPAATNGATVAAPKTTAQPARTSPSTGGRAAAELAIRALYDTLGRRPLESEMVAELERIGSPAKSRQFANKIRRELEAQDPELAARGADNVRPLTGTDG
ncbi:DUF2637 domain-containing protein [Streptomyces sp. NPDC101145]|uniref:DUF2637 domain-containing protein n=1 Tax=Streptomyces sp. NPDC101145 TaxID=3366112 RepID=UPI0038067816